MLFKNLFSKDKIIKGNTNLPVIARSSDGVVQITKLPIIRQLACDHKEDAIPLSWCIADRLKPLFIGSLDNPAPQLYPGHENDMFQFVLEDACVPQLTKYEPKYINDTISVISDFVLDLAMHEVDETNKKNYTYEIIKLGMLIAVVLFIITLIYSHYSG